LFAFERADWAVGDYHTEKVAALAEAKVAATAAAFKRGRKQRVAKKVLRLREASWSQPAQAYEITAELLQERNREARVSGPRQQLCPDAPAPMTSLLSSARIMRSFLISETWQVAASRQAVTPHSASIGSRTKPTAQTCGASTLPRLPVSRASINAHARGLDRRCPFIDFALDETAEILRRRLIVRNNPCAETFEPITHRGRVHRLERSVV
jgi:hypothetical protein